MRGLMGVRRPAGYFSVVSVALFFAAMQHMLLKELDIGVLLAKILLSKKHSSEQAKPSAEGVV